LNLPGLGGRKAAAPKAAPGTTPGIESLGDISKPAEPGRVRFRCIDYGPENIELQEVDDVDAFCRKERPEWSRVRWVNVDGLHPYVVDQLRRGFNFHTLAAEDVLRTPQRPKVESYDDHLFIVVRMLRLENAALVNEQVSIFLYHDTVITFQESQGDVWDPVRDRIQNRASRLRQNDSSYLLYTLLDAVVDHCFPILEQLGDAFEALETEVLENAVPKVQQRIHESKRKLALLRRVMWPMREVANYLQREETEEVSAFAKAYMRDVYDHTIQVMDIVETYREMAGGLNDLYMSVVSNRMNEIMKVLTIMASFFIPITFVAGVYGMNFDFIPELHWKYSYAAFWIIVVSMVGGLACYFYRRGWIGRG